MMTTELMVALERELQKHIDPGYKEQAPRFFKEKISLIGVRIPVVRKIAGTFFQQVKHLPKKTLFQVAEEKLLQQQEHEYQTIAFDWLHRIRKQLQAEDFAFLEHCLSTYVSNWAACDNLCTNVLGYFVYTYPESILTLKKRWTQSSNRWLRRAAAVTLIYALNKKQYLDEACAIADILL